MDDSGYWQSPCARHWAYSNELSTEPPDWLTFRCRHNQDQARLRDGESGGGGGGRRALFDSQASGEEVGAVVGWTFGQ